MSFLPLSPVALLVVFVVLRTLREMIALAVTGGGSFEFSVSFFCWLFVVGGAAYGGGDGAMGAFVVVGGFGRG